PVSDVTFSSSDFCGCRVQSQTIALRVLRYEKKSGRGIHGGEGDLALWSINQPRSWNKVLRSGRPCTITSFHKTSGCAHCRCSDHAALFLHYVHGDSLMAVTPA